MNDKEYFALDAINATLLKDIIKQSPVHAQARRDRDDKPNDAMILGTATHAAILDTNWDDAIAIAPDVDRRTTKGKDEYAAFVDSIGDKTVISQKQADLAEGMSKTVLNHPEALALLDRCSLREVVHVWENGSGLDCKAKIDAMDNTGVIVDLKTTRDASPEAFAKQSSNFLYHMQLAWYATAAEWGWESANCYIIAVENIAPHAVAVYKFDDDAIYSGMKLCTRAMKEWTKYKLDIALKNEPFAYGEWTHKLSLPAWADRE